MPKSLNVGCGPDIRPAKDGWVNMDIAPLPGVDVVHDIMQFPWPFADGTFDLVFLSHVMEHVPHTNPRHPGKDAFLLMMEEFHRVLRPGGRVEILSPHPDSPDVWADPTHTRIIHPKNFEYFSETSRYSYYSPVKFRVEVCEVSKRLPILPNFMRMGQSRLPITEHLALRVPALRRLLLRRPYEIHVVLAKPAAPAV